MRQPIFKAATVRNDKVAPIDDDTEKAKAAEAAGLSEWSISTLRPLRPNRPNARA